MSTSGIYSKIEDKVELLDKNTDWMSVEYEKVLDKVSVF
jgi:hypothetical protein